MDGFCEQDSWSGNLKTSQISSKRELTIDSCRIQRGRLLTTGMRAFLEEEMATHSSILAWKILWTEKPVRLQAMGLQKGQTQLRDQTTSTTLPRSSISGSTVDVWIHLFVQWILIKHLPWACSCSQHQSVSVKKTGRIMLTETSQNSGGHRQ